MVPVSSQSSRCIYATRAVRFAGVSLVAVLAVVASMELKHQAPQQLPHSSAGTGAIVLADDDDNDWAAQQEEEEQEQEQEAQDEEAQVQQQLALQEMLQSEQQAEAQNETG